MKARKPYIIKFRKYIQFILLVFSILVSFLWKHQANASITLVYFRAIAGDRKVVLQWKTGSEFNNAGFNIKRSLSQNGSYVKINPQLIFSQDPYGAEYEYTDDQVINGQIYWYYLESISTDTSQPPSYDGPISAIPNGPTPTNNITYTATATLLSTPTPTHTSTKVIRSTPSIKTNTVTPSPTQEARQDTPYPAPLSTTETPPAYSEAPTDTPINPSEGISSELITPSPTASLIPLPSITIEFPRTATTRAKDETRFPTVLPTDYPGRPAFTQSLGRYWVIILIGFVWFGMIIWFIVFFRKVMIK